MGKTKNNQKNLGEQKAKTRSLSAVSFAYFINYADAQALPTYYTSIGRELAITRASLGLITTARSALQTVAAPLWGYLADRYSRKSVLTVGCIVWGIFTLLCAASNNFSSLLFFRLLAGFGLAAIIPTGFSIIVDYYKPEERGKYLGIFQMIGILGIAVLVPVMGAIDAPSYTLGLESDLITLYVLNEINPLTLPLLTQLFIFDTFMKCTVHYGAWRLGFTLIAILSFVAAAVVWFLIKEPIRGASEKELKGVLTAEDAEKYKIERSAIGTIFRTRTILAMMAQGMIGYTPWIVLQAFLVHWLESVRYIPPTQATLLFAVLVVGAAVGNALGGFLGDIGERKSRNKGRIIVTQISVFSGIPLIFLILVFPLSITEYTILAFVTAILISWAGPAAVQPLVAMVTKPEIRSTAFSIEQMFEGGFAAVAAVVVGWLADTLNGGIAGLTMQTITPYMGYWLGVLPLSFLLVLFTLSGQSLTTAMLWTTVIPWTICFLIWFIPYKTFPKERDKILKILEERREELLKE
ncbi:MAG: MFS transporter [Candidatus Jordarchaeaceae archaeon]